MPRKGGRRRQPDHTRRGAGGLYRPRQHILGGLYRSHHHGVRRQQPDHAALRRRGRDPAVPGNIYRSRKRRKTTVVNVPDDILLYGVIPRLPAATLVRFKSVCKSWRDAISGVLCRPEFIAELAAASRLRRPSQLRIEVLNEHSVDGGDRVEGTLRFSKYHEVSGSLELMHEFPIRLWGLLCPDVQRPVHCDGLAAITCHTRVYVANPVLREDITLPESISGNYVAGLGFDPVSKRYKVVRAFNEGSLEHPLVGFQVFTLGSDVTWRTTNVKLKKKMWISTDPPDSCAGALYYNTTNIFGYLKGVISFNLCEEDVSDLVLPPTVCRCIYKRRPCEVRLTTVHGETVLMHSHYGCKVETWTLMSSNNNQLAAETAWAHRFTVGFSYPYYITAELLLPIVDDVLPIEVNGKLLYRLDVRNGVMMAGNGTRMNISQYGILDPNRNETHWAFENFCNLSLVALPTRTWVSNMSFGRVHDAV